MKRLNKKGFTLVELLAVIVVLALLMVVAASSIGTALDNSRKKALLTEAQKLATNITAEAQSLKLMGTLTNGATNIGVYNGKDADYTYDVTVNTHGYITSLKVCYGTDYYVDAIVVSTGSDSYTSSVTIPTTVQTVSGNNPCTDSGKVLVSSTAAIPATTTTTTTTVAGG